MTVAIPKAVDRAHIDENLGAMDFELDKEDIAELNSVKSSSA